MPWHPSTVKLSAALLWERILVGFPTFTSFDGYSLRNQYFRPILSKLNLSPNYTELIIPQTMVSCDYYLPNHMPNISQWFALSNRSVANIYSMGPIRDIARFIATAAIPHGTDSFTIFIMWWAESPWAQYEEKRRLHSSHIYRKTAPYP